MLKCILGLLFASQFAAADSMSNILTVQYLKKNKSFIYSPVSLEIALSMTAEGANGDTLKQFQDVLGLPNAEIYKKLDLQQTDYEFLTAQKVWVQQDYIILPLFEKSLTQNYKSSIEKVDFKHSSRQITPLINKWAEEKTKGKVKDLISENALSTLTRLVLVNAVYFKAKWAESFDSNRTEIRAFKSTAKTKEDIPFLHKYFSGLQYFDGKDFSSVVLPYKGNNISFHIFLPKKIGDELNENFLKNALSAKLADYKSSAVNVVLPKFKTEYTADVIPYLQAGGLKLPFDDKNADFSKISLTVKRSRKDVLYISNIFHKAFVEISEEGTEAAAAAAVEVKVFGAAMPAARGKDFTADHPFLYFIKQNDQILFVGYFAGNK